MGDLQTASNNKVISNKLFLVIKRFNFIFLPVCLQHLSANKTVHEISFSFLPWYKSWVLCRCVAFFTLSRFFSRFCGSNFVIFEILKYLCTAKFAVKFPAFEGAKNQKIPWNYTKLQFVVHKQALNWAIFLWEHVFVWFLVLPCVTSVFVLQIGRAVAMLIF